MKTKIVQLEIFKNPGKILAKEEANTLKQTQLLMELHQKLWRTGLTKHYKTQNILIFLDVF